MDSATFKLWWSFHVQVARGEPLTAEEREIYESGLQELERDENLQEVQRTREVREQLLALEGERTKLEKRRQALEREIANLESRLREETRHLLGVEE